MSEHVIRTVVWDFKNEKGSVTERYSSFVDLLNDLSKELLAKSGRFPTRLECGVIASQTVMNLPSFRPTDSLLSWQPNSDEVQHVGTLVAGTWHVYRVGVHDLDVDEVALVTDNIGQFMEIRIKVVR